MRWIYLAVVILFAAAIIIFAAQNRDMTTVSLLRMSLQMPLALLIAIVYALGALTGGSLLALLRKSVRGAQRRELATS
jgi:lipopolysaccharide assembly protein A